MPYAGNVLDDQKRLINAFAISAATTPDTAITEAQLGIRRFDFVKRRVLKRFCELGIAQMTDQGSYFYDQESAQNLLRNRTAFHLWRMSPKA